MYTPALIWPLDVNTAYHPGASSNIKSMDQQPYLHHYEDQAGNIWN